MARYKIILAYDGTDFHGYQRQGNVRTVQLVVEDALRAVGWRGKSLISAGRTDTGVHASGQVAVFEMDWNHPTDVLGKALNANLPRDVSVRSVMESTPMFHPRFDATSRIYRYSLFVSPTRDPLVERFAWRLETEVDDHLLAQAAAILPGVHDFAAFGSPMKKGGSTTREVFMANWERAGMKTIFTIQANAFLYRMVRRLVYAQVLVGQKRVSLETFEQGVLHKALQPSGIAPGNGLVLSEVLYDDELKS